MSKFDMIVELMVKNGVTTKFSENLFKNLVDDEPIIELDFTEHDKVFEDKIAKLEENIGYYKDSFYRAEKNYNKLYHENKELKQEKSDKNKKIGELAWENESLKQRIDELESKESEVCKNEPKISDSTPSMEWYENRHQSDCIEINRLNTTIDVLIHKVEYLRQFAGLE